MNIKIVRAGEEQRYESNCKEVDGANHKRNHWHCDHVPNRRIFLDRHSQNEFLPTHLVLAVIEDLLICQLGSFGLFISPFPQR